jgi:nucleoside-diphosphate-sugar epimerase
VLFVSSTSVYADDNMVVTEEMPVRPQTESGRQIVASEEVLQSGSNFKTTIVRFGGLVSDDRQPIKFLSGKEDLENPDGPVNLIHRDDCIGIIEAILEKNAWGEIFNGVAPYYPTREDHYTKKAIALGLPAPKFSRAKPSQGKTVSSQKVISVLGYSFK